MSCLWVQASAFLILSMSAMPALGSEEPETLFDRASRSAGDEYRSARDALLAAGPPAVAFLGREAGDPGVDEGRRWLAEIILERSRDPAEFARLEGIFADKVALAEFGGPSHTASGRPPKAVLTPPDPPEPRGPKTGSRPAPASITMMGREPFKAEYDRWRESLRLPESLLWSPLLGEVLLKGWSGPDLDAPSRGRPSREDYARLAIERLGRIGERRAAPALLEILRDPKRDPTGSDRHGHLAIRPLAAEALGRLRYEPALNTLLEMAEGPETPERMIAAVFEAIGRIDDRRAAPTMERIAARPNIPPVGAPGRVFNNQKVHASTVLRAWKDE